MIRRKKKTLREIVPFGWDFEEIAQNFFEEPMWDVSRSEMRPLTQVRETDDKVIVSIDLPYVKKENIELNVTEDRVEVTATMDRCVKYNRWGTVQKNCEFKSYRTSVGLPRRVTPESAVAKFKSGVLEIEIQKKVERHRIEVQ
jgi:HSP20 family protein